MRKFLIPPSSSHHDRFPVLDGIRGYAVLLVLLSHISNVKGLIFSGAGQLGVWLFFVLSAFLLSLYFFQAPQRIFSLLEWENYAFRRFTRIYPLYIGVLISGVLVGWWGVGALPGAMLLQDPVYWAIFVEFRFYFLLPGVVVVFWLAGRFSFALPPLLLIVALALHYRWFPDGSTVLGYQPWGQVEQLFSQYAIVFVVGSFTAWLYANTETIRAKLAQSRTADTLALFMIAATILALPGIINQIGRAVSWKVPADYYHYQWVPWSVFFAVLIYLTLATNGAAKALFVSRPMRLFGFISYSMYLTMDFVILPFEQINNPTLYAITTFTCSTLTAWALFTLVERPISRLNLLSLRTAQPPPLANDLIIPQRVQAAEESIPAPAEREIS